MGNEEMRLECSRLHERHSQRLKALEDHRDKQNGALLRMADSVDALRSRMTYMVIAMVIFMAMALPEMFTRFVEIVFR